MAATYSSLVGLAVGSKYEVRRVLGVGGMGVVCEAVHLDLGKKVAIKLIDKSMKESELIVARFRREARALGQIQSEHIVDVFDVGADQRVGLYMVMEYLDGEDLQTRLEREKRLDLTTCVMIGHQVARGLEKAHAAKVIHRDLKPANVFLTKRDNGGLLVKLLDFGVSKLLGDAGGARITGSGAPIGTPLYMSPEQAEGKDDTDARADVWSLGALLYEALAGAPPFADRGSYHGTIVGILTSRPKLLHDAAPWVPPALARVVDAMLVHDRESRIKDAATVTKRLLDAYPEVLPDGTGRHTAVIVPKTTSSVDATGDTEIFTSAAFHKAMADQGSGGRDSNPSSREDSKRTVPDPSALAEPVIPNEALRTAAATPIDIGGASAASAAPRPAAGNPPSFPDPMSPSYPPGSGPSPSSGSTTGPKTVPFATPSSSASGVAMPGTPPIIEPLPLSEKAPDTTRDEELALRAERRRWLSLVAVALGIAGVAVAGYFIGKRSGPHEATPPVVTSAPPPPATVTAPATTPAPSASVPSFVPSALPSASEAPAPSASAGFVMPKGHGPRKLFKPKLAGAAADDPNVPKAEPPPENPYADPSEKKIEKTE
ncbi:MAG: serine/threonine protein kinase [Deltaproteobacteria bacterium]|nr:serine/threonine protein kinase [Deltaproteobacteria bacterium]